MKNKKIILLILIALTIIKIVITASLPMFINSSYRYDDVLMIDMASSIIDGNWLGTYSEVILTKGMFYPLFIAILNFINIPYLLGLTIFYTLATILFCYSIKDFFKRKAYVYLIYILLLFEPISYSFETFQRIYRNSLGASLLLLLITSFLLLIKYQKINNRKAIIWSFISGLFLSMMFLTREDTIWILPFIFVLLTASIIYLLKNGKKKMIILSFIPFLILFLNINFVSYINYKQYRVYTINELTDSSFTEAYKKIISVKQSEYPYRVSVPKTTLNKIKEVSPTFNMIARELDESNWDVYGKGEIIDGYLFWALRDVAALAGYYKDSQTSNDFWSKINIELEKGLNKELEKRMIMPNIYMSPYRSNYFNDTIKMFFESVVYVSMHEDVGSSKEYSSDIGKLDEYKKILNDKFSNITVQKKFELPVKVLNVITEFYKTIFPLVSIIGLVSYILIIVNFFKKREHLDKIIFLTAILFSYITLLLGVSYTHISAFDSISYYYLAPAYIIQIIFCLVSFFIYIESLKKVGGKNG